MRIALPKLLLVSLLLAACGGPSQADIAATAEGLAATGLAQTAAAIPTDTPTAIPTDTPEPSPTFTEAPTDTATLAPSDTPAPVVELPTPTWQAPSKTAPLRLQNNSGEEVLLIILSPVYQEIRFKSSRVLTFDWGTYSYRLWIGGDGPYVGTFSITNDDKHTLVIEQDKVYFLVP